jgi:putative ABC transport system substrate-binding protein
VPAIYFYHHFVREGGLMSYGIESMDLLVKTTTYVDRILRGAKPGDLPVQMPTKIELVINVKTAKALGITIPPSIMVRAVEVIE